MPVTEAAGVVRGLTVPAGAALVIAVMIAIMVVTTLITRLRRSLPFDLPFACAAVCNPQAVLTDAPRAILHAGTVHA